MIANKYMKAHCFEPVLAAKYMTINTSIKTEAIDWDVDRPNIFFIFFDL